LVVELREIAHCFFLALLCCCIPFVIINKKSIGGDSSYFIKKMLGSSRTARLYRQVGLIHEES
jgi:hypothetical protein